MKSIAKITIVVALLVNVSEASHFKQMVGNNLQQYCVKNSAANVTADCCPDKNCGKPSSESAAPALKEAKKAAKKIAKKLD